MLEVRHVSKRFSGTLAVDDVSFRAAAGEVTGYLGPNGSGKSTTIKMIAGLVDTTSGEIVFNGHSIHQDLNAWKQRMGYVPEEPHLYAHLLIFTRGWSLPGVQIPDGTARHQIDVAVGERDPDETAPGKQHVPRVEPGRSLP
jgi:ABC-type Fe3+/spermidine/putrescine transport system ATPase subunit